MTNAEALEILRKESEFRKNMLPLSPLLEKQGADLLTQAINDFLSHHWVAIYGVLMYGLGCFVGHCRERRSVNKDDE